jgi:hypothetical protein
MHAGHLDGDADLPRIRNRIVDLLVSQRFGRAELVLPNRVHGP